MVLEITDRTRKAVVDSEGRSFQIETATLKAGEAHQVFLTFCDGLLMAYQVLPLPGFSFEPVALSAMVAEYYARRVRPKSEGGGSESE